MAVIVAVGVDGKNGDRDVLGVDVDPGEGEAFWISFLRFLVACRLLGVRLATSNAHRGLKGATEKVLQGAFHARRHLVVIGERR